MSVSEGGLCVCTRTFTFSLMLYSLPDSHVPYYLSTSFLIVVNQIYYILGRWPRPLVTLID